MMKDLKKNYITHDQEHVASVTLFASEYEMSEDLQLFLYTDEACTNKVSGEVLFDLAMKQLVVVAVPNGDRTAYYLVNSFNKEYACTAVTIYNGGGTLIFRSAIAE